MNLHEYQAKEIFQQCGVPVPLGMVVQDESQVPQAFETISGERFGVAKAQVLTGGRGKAGGIKIVDSISDAREAVSAILAMTIKGLTPEKVLIEEKLQIRNEYFMSITIDPEACLPALLMSPKGGMDVEEVAKDYPSLMGKYIIEPDAGLPSYAVIHLADLLGFPRELRRELTDFAKKLYRVFVEKEATLIESNPLAELAGGKLVAADARLNVDDNALFRHPELSVLKAQFQEMRLKDKGVDYIDLGSGEIGLLCVGAGMTMLTMDLVAELGAKAKCFLDISHGVNPQGFGAALDVLQNDPSVQCVFVNMFGGLTRMDDIARSMLQAIDGIQGGFPKPIVLRLQGTNAEQGQSIMREAGYQVCSELEDALVKLKAMLGEGK